MIISDAREDPLVRDNRAVSDLGIVAYAGIPLVTEDGHTLGSFSVGDHGPRRWADEELDLLADLAASVRTEIELRRLAERATREQALLETVLERSPYGVIISDAAGRLIRLNPAAERIWAGRAEAENVDDWSKYHAFHPDGRPYEGGDWSMARSLTNREVVAAEEYRIQRFDGTFGWLLGGAAPLIAADGELLGAVAVFADISGLKVHETENRARALEINDDVIQGVTAAILALDLERGDQARESLATALGSARRIVNDLLRDTGPGSLGPGDLRRSGVAPE